MPVYSTHQLSASDLQLGARLRAVRQARGMTLQEVAKAAGLSSGRLSELENNRRALDLDQALAIATALGQPLSALLPDEHSLPYQIVRADTPRDSGFRRIPLADADGRAAWHPNPVFPLADLFVGRHLEPLIIRTEPARDRSLRLFAHHEQEFLCVLRGRIELVLDTPVGREQVELRQGDSLFFWSCLPHVARALDGAAAETLNVSLSSPSFQDSGPFWLRPASESIVDPHLSRAASVGRRIQRLRTSAGLSVAELAGRLNIRPRRLQLAESGVRTLPIDVLLRLSRLFSHPLRGIVGESARPPYFTVLRSEDIAKQSPLARRTPIGGTPAATRFRSLAPDFPARGMFPVLVQVPSEAAGTGSSILHEHHGEEFIYVFEGRLEVRIRVGERQVTEILRSGDCCYLDSSVPHSIHSHADNPHRDTAVQALDVFWSPLGEDYLFAQ